MSGVSVITYMGAYIWWVSLCQVFILSVICQECNRVGKPDSWRVWRDGVGGRVFVSGCISYGVREACKGFR